MPQRFPATAALALSFAIGCSHHKLTRSSTLRPLNVLVVTIDTLRADHVGCYGDKQAETPNLDELAASGALFERAIAQAPLTPPSHASIFTGLNPPADNVRDIGGFVLDPSHQTLATLLHNRGWKTAAFVGASVLKRGSGFEQGFDFYDDEMPRPEPGIAAAAHAERPAATVVDRALRWLNGQPAGSPWFLWVHVYDPHAPHVAPVGFRERFKGRPYDGEIAYTDHELGRLFAGVKSSAVIAVLSDHGESLSEHGEFTHGIFLYDATLHIPFLLSGPGVPAGVRVNQQVRTIDLFPTLLDLLGGTAPSQVQGITLVPFLQGRGEETLAYSETLFPKIHMGWSELRSLRTSRWKYIRAPRPELYDVTADPAELHDLASERPDEVNLFEARLAAVAGEHTVHSNAMNEQTRRELQSLGYLAGVSGREFKLDGGADPKDRVAILKLLEESVAPGTRTTLGRRIALLREAQRLDPANPEVLDQLGRAYEDAHEYGKALNVYNLAIKKGVESGRVYSQIGNLEIRLGKRKDAIAAYEHSIQFNPSDIDTQSNLATAYAESGRMSDASQVFKRMLVLDPQYAPAYNGLGVIAIQQGDSATARTQFEHAVGLNPSLAEAWLNLGLLYKQAGDAARARDAFSRFLSVSRGPAYAKLIPKVQDEMAALQ